MRLIRLTTNDDEAIFDNQLRDDLYLPKSGKIGLLNAAIHLAPVAFTIGSDNKIIKYQNSTLGERSVTLDEAVYDENTYPNLFLDIQNKLNADAIFTGANNRVLGTEWKCDVPSGDTNVVIEYKRGLPVDDTTYSALNSVDFYDDGELLEAALMSQDGEPPAAEAVYNTCMVTRKYISTGCGFTRSHIYALAQSSSPAEGPFHNGMILALTETDMTTFAPADFSRPDITYGIYATINAAGVYQYYTIHEGAHTLSTTVPGIVGEGDPDNDDMEIIIDGDKVKLNVYQGAGRIQTTLAEFDYDVGNQLFPVNVIKGGNQSVDVTPLTAVMSQLSYTPSPYSPYNPPTLTEVPYVPDTTPYPNYLEFGSDSLANYLGFSLRRQPTRVVSQASYRANYAFSVFAKHDAFLVELSNIPLKSYDCFENQRKNILGVMPVSDAAGDIIYEAPTPFFIDIDNDFDILLRNIRARVVQSDYQPLKTRGLTTLTILVSD